MQLVSQLYYVSTSHGRIYKARIQLREQVSGGSSYAFLTIKAPRDPMAFTATAHIIGPCACCHSISWTRYTFILHTYVRYMYYTHMKCMQAVFVCHAVLYDGLSTGSDLPVARLAQAMSSWTSTFRHILSCCVTCNPEKKDRMVFCISQCTVCVGVISAWFVNFFT